MKESDLISPFSLIRENAHFSFLQFKKISKILLLTAGLILGNISCTDQMVKSEDDDRIKPFAQNPKYWKYKGQPIMLLGANKTDSPYLLPDQEAYYDTLTSLGGNYTRYNVKQRLVEGLVQKFPYQKLPEGLYDLNLWDEEYWNRFEEGFRMTHNRNIIVQLELWDRFDVGCDIHYLHSPWRPANNVIYSESESGLPDIWEGCDQVSHKHPFFSTLPTMENNQLVFDLQKKFADKVLSIALNYDHVLYVITNETTLDPEWSVFWARYIKEKANAKNKKVEISEMPWTIANSFPFSWQQPELGNPNKWINHVIDNAEIYSFCAFQFQPILKSRQDHYDRIFKIYERVGKSPAGPRPVNAVKVFARQGVINGEDEPNAQTRFWRPLMAGWAALSLHREYPNSGYLGFSELGKKNLSAARKFCDAIVPWECNPRQDLLQNREPDEAYLLANPGKSYGFYFPTSGTVELDLKDFAGSLFSLQWISIESGEYFGEPKSVSPISAVSLQTPDTGSNAGWAATLIKSQ